MAAPTTVVATLEGKLSPATIQGIPDAVGMLEVQGDLSAHFSAASLRKCYSGKLLFTLPPGSCPPTTRRQALIQAADDYDLVQLEADQDLSPALLAAIPAPRRLICWRGQSAGVAHLRSVFERISAVPACFYSLITQGQRSCHGIPPLQLLKELQRKDVVAYCDGKAGFWSRILAPYFGAPLIFAKLDRNSGEPSVQQLTDDYGFPTIYPLRELYGIVGNRVFQSPSPRLHNAGYRVLGHPALFLPFYVESFEDFWREMIQAFALDSLGYCLKGCTIVSPFKEAASHAASIRSQMAARAQASNILLRRNGRWEAHTTDSESISPIVHSNSRLSILTRAAVIGCGGAGRAIAAALQQAGANVTLVNRGKERGELAVSLLGLPFVPLPQFKPHGFSLLVNGTPVGRDDDSLPFEIDSLNSRAVVVDLVYRAGPTPLVTGVVARGGFVIDGYDVLLNQVRKQFQMMTGRELPSSIGRHTVNARTLSSNLCADAVPMLTTMASATANTGLG